MPPKVFVSGCFDVLHSGHIRFFEEASQYGDLYVSIGSDETIKKLKNRETLYNEDERLYMVSSIKYVHNLGSRISLSEYSPIPYTKDWQTLPQELKQDPLTQNNTYFMTLNKDYDKLIKLKEFAKELNKKLQS